MDWSAFDYPINSALGRKGWPCESEPTYGRVTDDGSVERTDEHSLEDLLATCTYDRVYFSQEGENDGQSWIFVVRKRCDENQFLYIAFEAWCDYTGFDCRGKIDICYADDLAFLCKHGTAPFVRARVSEMRAKELFLCLTFGEHIADKILKNLV